jgi:glycosyltransferase involved in cell wall biosynthesis
MRVSVVITSYNRPERIGATLRSLAAQTYQPDEILIADDCSPNDPSDVVENHRIFFHQRVHYFRHETNLGMPGNLNFLLRRAAGEIIVNLHDADEFDPTYLEKLLGAMDADQRIGIAFTGWTFTDNAARRHLPAIARITPGRDFFEQHLMRAVSCPIWGTVALRRTALETHGLLDPKFGPLADVDYWAKVCLTHDVAYVAEPLLVLYPIGTHGNEWRWLRYDLGRRINAENLRRHLSDRASKLRIEQVLHHWRYLYEYFFGMLHLARRQKWRMLREGIRYFPISLARKRDVDRG